MARDTRRGLVHIGADNPERSDPAILDLASKLERFGCVNPDLLARKGAVVKYDRGAIIPSSDLSHLHLILNGAIQVMHYAASGRSVLVHEYKAGQPFCGCDILSDLRMSAQAVASDTVTA